MTDRCDLPNIPLRQFLACVAADQACDDERLSEVTLRAMLRDYRDHAKGFLGHGLFTTPPAEVAALHARVAELERALEQIRTAAIAGMPEYGLIDIGEIAIAALGTEAGR